MSGIKKQSVRVESFSKQLKRALKKYHDAYWLGTQSPLTTPYFLGDILASRNGARHTAQGRGEVLQDVLTHAANHLWGENQPKNRIEIEELIPDILQEPGGQRYAFLVLELRYFQRFFKPRRLSDIWELFLGQSRAEFYRDLDKAIQQLGEILLKQIQPTFRLEEPILTKRVIGRERIQQQCLDALLTKQAVMIGGPGGVGKTTLGTAIALSWPNEAVFWFTIRPTLNDQLSGLLFSLGYFLYKQGAAGLWQKLVADSGKVEDVNLALGLLRHDLMALEDVPPLLCFDELDYLHPAEADNPVRAHVSIVQFLDSLRGLAPLLMIGQRALLDSDVYHILDGLGVEETSQLVRGKGISFKQSEVGRLHSYTNGNPRLLQLCLAMHEENQALEDLLKVLPRAALFQSVFSRLWTRITATERLLLQGLAVFRGSAPEDAWLEEVDALKALMERSLVQRDRWGGITLWPTLRSLIYGKLPVELREQLHVSAAVIRAARGEYTAAAYHLGKGGNYKEAIQLWFPSRQQEISRGQAEAARTIFEEISLRRLAKREKQALALLRAELNNLAGEIEAGLSHLRSVTWPLNSEQTLKAKYLEARFLAALGYPERAIESYEEGIVIGMRVLNQLVRFHHYKGRLFVRQRNMNQAWREARLAQYEAQNLQAMVQMEQGHYDDAYISYQQALTLAQSLEHDVGIAQTHRDLGILLSRQGRLDEVIMHTEQAITYYDKIEDHFNKAVTQNTLTAVYVQCKQFEKAIDMAMVTLPFFEQMRNPYYISVTAANLAEAYFSLGDMEKAEFYAYLVLQQEERGIRPYGLYTLALVKRTHAKLSESEQLMRESLGLSIENGDKFMEAYARRALGEICFDLDQVAEGRILLDEARQLFERLGVQEEAEATQELLS